MSRRDSEAPMRARIPTGAAYCLLPGCLMGWWRSLSRSVRCADGGPGRAGWIFWPVLREDPVGAIVSVGVEVLGTVESGSCRDLCGGDVVGSDSGDDRAVWQVVGCPVDDCGGGFGGNAVAPRGGVQAVEEVEDLPVCQSHQLQAAEPQAEAGVMGVARVDDPVAEAVALPVLVPSVVEILGVGTGGEHVGRIVRACPRVVVDAVDGVDVGGG